MTDESKKILKYGDKIKAKMQSVPFNISAQHFPIEDKWIKVITIISPGSLWRIETFPVRMDGDLWNSRLYLVNHHVGPDGWGCLHVYKDVEIIGNEGQEIKRYQDLLNANSRENIILAENAKRSKPQMMKRKWYQKIN